MPLYTMTGYAIARHNDYNEIATQLVIAEILFVVFRLSMVSTAWFGWLRAEHITRIE